MAPAAGWHPMANSTRPRVTRAGLLSGRALLCDAKNLEVSSDREAGKTVQWTVLSCERREPKRAARGNQRYFAAAPFLAMPKISKCASPRILAPPIKARAGSGPLK